MDEETLNKELELKSFYKFFNLDPIRFQFLEKLTGEELHSLKNSIVENEQEGQKEIWSTMARVSKYMPNFLNAKVTEDILGASIAANLSYHLPPQDAIGIANYFSTKFFCDVLEHLVPEKIEAMISVSPVELMKRAVAELILRKNFFLIGSLIDYTPIDSVDKVARNIPNPEDLISITVNTKDKTRVLKLFEKFEDIKIFNILKSGINGSTREELKEIYVYASPELKEKSKRILKERDMDTLTLYQEFIEQ
ncbi:MAG: hypothetical protein SFU98_13285 [Leptospiraceae bacterium]|nr:hypothetical protein [Leptospiraceae bacterium]